MCWSPEIVYFSTLMEVMVMTLTMRLPCFGKQPSTIITVLIAIFVSGMGDIVLYKYYEPVIIGNTYTWLRVKIYRACKGVREFLLFQYSLDSSESTEKKLFNIIVVKYYYPVIDQWWFNRLSIVMSNHDNISWIPNAIAVFRNISELMHLSATVSLVNGWQKKILMALSCLLLLIVFGRYNTKSEMNWC